MAEATPTLTRRMIPKMMKELAVDCGLGLHLSGL
jgi:hypothetical protein